MSDSELVKAVEGLPWMTSEYLDNGEYGILNNRGKIVLGLDYGYTKQQCEAIVAFVNSGAHEAKQPAGEVDEKLRNMMLAHLDGVYKFSAREDCDDLITQLINIRMQPSQPVSDEVDDELRAAAIIREYALADDADLTCDARELKYKLLAASPQSSQPVNAVDPDMPSQQLRLHMGEMTAQEERTARAAIRWANSAMTQPVNAEGLELLQDIINQKCMRCDCGIAAEVFERIEYLVAAMQQPKPQLHD